MSNRSKRIGLATILCLESAILLYVSLLAGVMELVWPLAALSIFVGGKVREWRLEDVVSRLRGT